jgi:hypothetical protein
MTPSDGLGSVSERDVVMREREAFQRGCRYAAGAILRSTHVDQERAAKRYPLPKIHRLRVVSDSTGVQFRCNAGRLQFRNATFQHWDDDVIPRFAHAHLDLQAERFEIFASLLKCPAETVDDPGSSPDGQEVDHG